MIDISMQYLGMKLSGPIVVASTPLSESIDNVRHMEDAGASAIVLTSLFEEQLALESRTLDEDLSRGTDSFAESLDFLPELERLPHDARWLSRAPAARARGGRHSHHGQPERRHHRRLGALCQRDGAGRRGRHRTEHLRAGHGPQPDFGRARAATARTGRQRLQGGQDSRGRQALAIVHQPAASVRAA